MIEPGTKEYTLAIIEHFPPNGAKLALEATEFYLCGNYFDAITGRG